MSEESEVNNIILNFQSTLGQCLGRVVSPVGSCRGGLSFDGLAYDGLALDGAWPRRAGCSAIVPAAELAASYGGGLSITSSSCAAPTGIAVTSENIYEGPVALAGNLPFLGTATMEGVFPTAGASAISYGCGDGIVAITAEGSLDGAITPATIASPALAAAAGPWGYQGIPACGCGCGSSNLY